MTERPIEDVCSLYGTILTHTWAAYITEDSDEEIRQIAEEGAKDLNSVLLGMDTEKANRIRKKFEDDVEDLIGYRPTATPSERDDMVPSSREDLAT